MTLKFKVLVSELYLVCCISVASGAFEGRLTVYKLHQAQIRHTVTPPCLSRAATALSSGRQYNSATVSAT